MTGAGTATEGATAEGGREQSGLAASVAAALRGYWTEAAGYQRVLYIVGAALLLSAGFHLVVLLASGGSWEGAVSWRKPILFGWGFGLTAISVSWVMSFLPKKPLVGWPLSLILGISVTGEVVWVSIQQWRGVPSHFNLATTFDANAFYLGGGMLILFTGIVVALVTLASFFFLQAPPSFAVGIRVGLLLLVASHTFGGLIIRNGLQRVLDPETGAFIPEGVEQAAIFGAAGAMKLPHALSLHGIQVLPILAILLMFTSWEEARRTRAVTLAAAGYTGLVAVSVFQTFNGLAPLDIGLPLGIVLVASVLGLVGAFAWVLRGLRARQRAPSMA